MEKEFFPRTNPLHALELLMYTLNSSQNCIDIPSHACYPI
jgi:hypothetical protein